METTIARDCYLSVQEAAKKARHPKHSVRFPPVLVVFGGVFLFAADLFLLVLPGHDLVVVVSFETK